MVKKQLPTFAVVEDGLTNNERLYLLIENGSFWGMGYLDETENINKISDLKEKLTPYADNDFIRNSIYAYVSANPQKKVAFEHG